MGATLSTASAVPRLDGGRVEAALEAGGANVFVIVALSLVCSAQSILLNAFAYLQPCIVAPLGATLQKAGLLSVANFAVSVVAAPGIGAVSELYGRRIAILVPMCVLALALVLAVTAQNFSSLQAWISLSGVGQGCMMVGLCLAAECAPPSSRGTYLNTANFVSSLGTVLVSAVAWAILGNGIGGEATAWRIFFGIAATAPLALGALFSFGLIESPYWLLSRGRDAEAHAALLALAAGGCGPPSVSGASREREANMAEVLGSEAERRASIKQEAAAGVGRRVEQPSLAQAMGSDGWAAIRRTPGLSRQTALHWALWLLGSFGWASVIYFTTDAMGGNAPASLEFGRDEYGPGGVPVAGAAGAAGAAAAAAAATVATSATAAVANARARRLRVLPAAGAVGVANLLAAYLAAPFGHTAHRVKHGVSGGAASVHSAPIGPTRGTVDCHFDFWRLNIVGLCELVGTVITHVMVDTPMGPRGLLGGRRGCQLTMYSTSALAVLVMGVFAEQLGANGVLVFGMVARGAVTAGNSAMWIAAPEMYPTPARTFGANVAFIINLLGALPASSWCYADLPLWAIALGVAAANLGAGVLALYLPETNGRRLDGPDDAAAAAGEATGLAPAERGGKARSGYGTAA